MGRGPRWFLRSNGFKIMERCIWGARSLWPRWSVSCLWCSYAIDWCPLQVFSRCSYWELFLFSFFSCLPKKIYSTESMAMQMHTSTTHNSSWMSWWLGKLFLSHCLITMCIFPLRWHDSLYCLLVITAATTLMLASSDPEVDPAILILGQSPPREKKNIS